ncbi:MAG: MCP four helix bundle domain-containing protein [Propionivibrio sp.]|uniref:HAMP domain-containing methyl-accepting chemotaxis protein n=1 Tax=Propionivibrio sp. TaxID=2212460 RepID=UPI001B70C813|nr:methyl-accepting chemotaxis protein [Propionivibrio sp.]MBP7201976.1 MCP four helix bundle domain-containing protein [Propionivibrio sp.]
MKLTISRQLSLMALVTIAILPVVGIIGNRVASSINPAVENSEKIIVPTVESIGTMRLAFLDIQVAVPGHIAAYNEGEKKELDARITASQQTFATTLADYEKIAASSGQKNGESVVVKTVEDIDAIALSVSSSAELINRLETQSREIASVVNVIKEVADQTNLLALNAAIEAARAGEQGRGFAVVADEVRKLAERTGNSTREITDTIDVMREGAQAASTAMMNAVEQVTASVSRASGACDMIRKIGEGSREAVGMVSEITDAIHEQSASSTSVAQSVERIAQMAEQSAAAAQGGADTAQQLNTLAQKMRMITDQYKL